MLDALTLKGLIVAKGYCQKDVAEQLGITPKTFYKRLKSGVFKSNEIDQLVKLLDISDPVAIFFADKAAQRATKKEGAHDYS